VSKYNNRRVTLDGHTFDSVAERRRYQELCLLRAAGELTGLVTHPRFPLVVNGVPIATYEADFGYTETATGRAVVEDVKGVRTDVYRIKCRLMRACYGIEVKEVAA
jgi:hypothetical protein